MQEFFHSAWWLLVTLGLLVTFHEYGHFVVARACGVKVLRFSVGFGKPLWSRYDRHGTEFAIAAIPLGGYVKMLDEREGDVDPSELGMAFNRKPVSQRIAIAAAGPAFNLLFALLAFYLMFLFGRPDYQPVIAKPTGIAEQSQFREGDRLIAVDGAPVDTWSGAITAIAQSALAHEDVKVSVESPDGSRSERTLRLSSLPPGSDGDRVLDAVGLRLRAPEIDPIAATISADSPAAAAGMQAGDRIVAINDRSVDDYAQIGPLLQQMADIDPALTISVRRDGSVLDLPVTVAKRDPGDGEVRWILGIGAGAASARAHDATLRYGPIDAIPAAVNETWGAVRSTGVAIWKLLTGAISAKNVSGIITIAQVANTSAQMGVAWFLSFLALISLNLAILNLLPIPVLDGGHLLFYFVELIKGSPVSERVQMAGQTVGLVMLVGLMGLAIYNDILRLAF
ncbi:MAG: RIP metalloprotease RseP [Dokdonella sp.]